eukprot:gb/GECG01006954.1/.p1 GENE.gb/GECG01006954.1/~~gb/GECG01006954.1/.p1  ORF type:complete len:126 (+),score=5.89 gb/GECG01006954.1/:1-378(+)
MQALRRTHGFLGRATMARFQSTQPAAAATTYSKPSWLESLVFDLPDQNPLDEAFPGVPAPQGRTAYVGVGPEKVQQSKLANGVQIGSVDAGGPVRKSCAVKSITANLMTRYFDFARSVCISTLPR